MRFTMLAVVATFLFQPTQSFARPAAAFESSALSDNQLSAIRGTARSGFFAQTGRSLTENEAMVNFRTTADVNRLTFDNWFVDVGTPLIFSNIAQQSSLR